MKRIRDLTFVLAAVVAARLCWPAPGPTSNVTIIVAPPAVAAPARIEWAPFWNKCGWNPNCN